MITEMLYWLDIDVWQTYKYQLNDRRCISIHAAMTTSSNGNIFRVVGHLCREFTGNRGSIHWSKTVAQYVYSNVMECYKWNGAI